MQFSYQKYTKTALKVKGRGQMTPKPNHFWSSP